MPTAYTPNPYGSPVHLWTDAVRKAHRVMPRTADGHIVQPKFVLKRDQASMTARWRRWSEAHPASLWPIWLAAWLEANPTKEGEA